MAFCSNCGQELAEGAQFCNKCGTPQTSPVAGDSLQGVKEFAGKVLASPDHTAGYQAEDIQGGKLMGILSYLSWLVLIPLFAAKQSPFVRFHTNQGLILAILGTVYGLVTSLVCTLFGLISGVLSAVFGWIFGLAGLVFLGYMVLGIVNVATGKAKELPYIGKYQILN